MSVLIVTWSGDNDRIPRVMDILRERGHDVARLDTDRLPHEVSLSIEYVGTRERIMLRDGSAEIDLDAVDTLWVRRYRVGAGLPQDMDPELRRVALRESEDCVLGAITAMRAFKVERPWVLARAERKSLQLKVARAVGLEVPRTLITSDPAAARAFALAYDLDVIAKPVAGVTLHRGTDREAIAYTRRLTPEDLDAIDAVRWSPMVFQQCVPKARELRVTVVGDRVFTASVDSQRSPEGREDWRLGVDDLMDEWRADALPDAVHARVLALMDRLGLNYGAIDFILTPDGRYVFLEVNPAGEFAWLTDTAGLPICEGLADLLSGRTRRRCPPALIEGCDAS